ncbi:hypothetical protein FRB95_002095 [Tulasnella sp. JGI-2019a]|nr:hypothetical protein FRB95_002095 [Tulasnella sp. JGI-2019a]
MLSLLASILSWTDPERETAGLQRAGAGGGSTIRKSMAGSRPATASQGKVEESESFSNMFVEFLLKESAQGQAEASSPLSTTPSRQLSLPSSSPPGSPGGRSPLGSSSQGTPRIPLISLSQSRQSLSIAPTPGPPPPRKKDQG